MAARRIEALADDTSGHERAGRIVDENEFGIEFPKEFQAVVDRFLTRCPTRYELDGRRADRLPGERLVVRVDDRDDSRDRRVCREDADGPAQHRFAADPGILLRHVAAGAFAAPGRHDDGRAVRALSGELGLWPVGHAAAHITDPASFPSRGCRGSGRGLGSAELHNKQALDEKWAFGSAT